MSVHVNAEYAHEMTARENYTVSWLQVLLPDYYECKQRFSSVIGASSIVVIGWDRNTTVHMIMA